MYWSYNGPVIDSLVIMDQPWTEKVSLKFRKFLEIFLQKKDSFFSNNTNYSAFFVISNFDLFQFE